MRRLSVRTLILAALIATPFVATHADAKPKKKAAVTAPAKDKKKPADLKLKAEDTEAQEQSQQQQQAQGNPPPSRGPTRIDFDDRLIQGQTNKSGAVYLYDRKELKTRSMIKKRDSFREEIITTVYDG